jgi:predicted nucleic acid-binding protein
VVDTRLTFVDANVLAYAHDRSEAAKRPVARALLETLWRDRAGVLSTQVLQELYVVVTRKFDPPMPRSAARLVTEDLQPGRRIGGVTIENPFA